MVVVVGIADNLVYLGFDFFPMPHVAHVGGVNFVIEVANVADHCSGLQGPQHGGGADVVVTRCRYQHIGGAEQVGIDATIRAIVNTIYEGRYHLEAIHTRLHGADRVTLGDAHNHALLA